MTRFFFGWWLLVGLFVIYTASNGILLNTLPMFYPSLMAEFGWSEAEVTRPAALFFFASGFMSIISGFFLDRFSVKRIMLIGLAGMVAALGYYSSISSLGGLMTIYFVFAAGLAMGGLLPSMLLLTRWFVRLRGIAIGILLLAASLGGMVFPPIVAQRLALNGWRQTVMELAIISAVMMIVPVLFLVRNYPRDMGLQPDGEAAPSDTAKTGPATDGPTLMDAVKSPLFYLLVFTTATLWVCVTGVINHQTIYLGQDLGVGMSMLGLIISVFFGFSIIGYLLFGYLSDHFKKGHILMLAVINLAVGLIVLRVLNSDSTVLIFVYAAIYGMGFSGAFVMVQLIVAEYFSGSNYGKILGLFVFIDTIASGIGIEILGQMRVAMGSYIPAFNVLIVLCAAAAICVFFINQRHMQTHVSV